MNWRLLVLGLLLPASPPAQPVSWDAGLTLVPAGEFVHAGSSYRSSSSLGARWASPHGVVVRRYILDVTEARSRRAIDLAPEATEALVTDLKAGTTYTARLRACMDDGCATFIEANERPSAATADEYWRVNGSGHSFATADRVVDDGNVGSYAFKYGSWAGPELDGRLQLYYNPIQRDEKGAKIAELTKASPRSPDEASRFRGVSGYGLLRVCAPQNSGNGDPACVTSRSLATGLALFQAVPLSPEGGGRVRLYFEAEGYDGRTRILHLDSRDGYIGRDFHAGPATRCSTLADYSAGGGCDPSLDIGVDVDGANGFPGIRNARQFKVAYPTRDSWAWDLAPGAFMWFTTEWPNGSCSTFGFNAAFAVWNGTRWVVQAAEAAEGCPKMLKGVQAPAPVHLGGARYKLYFNRHSTPGGVTNPLTTIKPMQMIYADGERTGDARRVDFEDWEGVEAARDVHYLWPDGTPLTEDEESRLDDYVILAPTTDPTALIMYSNMSATGAGALPFIGSAVLVNP